MAPGSPIAGHGKPGPDQDMNDVEKNKLLELERNYNEDDDDS